MLTSLNHLIQGRSCFLGSFDEILLRPSRMGLYHTPGFLTGFGSEKDPGDHAPDCPAEKCEENRFR
jgi:hypothetical protein